ncbi:Ig-like domain-containing protein [Cognatiyoonia sp. IB215446]|uniref:Ig-like domain-containing protein n=1 Tax=Cognatiyoonia sp. IB215446 TaxID=3097355 RepID=UPI002A11A6D8|nr:Ig-like domain-containing protein [Cognatiyoonia sp. IB215446]MDX8348616.1 Ig-like domain-containing protein [Cognatiyoonia sp. IB215446]
MSVFDLLDETAEIDDLAEFDRPSNNTYEIGRPANTQVHHLIPKNVINENFALRFMTQFEVFDMNGAENTTPLTSVNGPGTPIAQDKAVGSLHRGQHPTWDDGVERVVDDANGKLLSNTNTSAFKAAAREAMQDAIDDGIIDNDGNPIGQNADGSARTKADVGAYLRDSPELSPYFDELAAITSYLRTKLMPGGDAVMRLNDNDVFLEGRSNDLTAWGDSPPAAFLNSNDPRIPDGQSPATANANITINDYSSSAFGSETSLRQGVIDRARENPLELLDIFDTHAPEITVARGMQNFAERLVSNFGFDPRLASQGSQSFGSQSTNDRIEAIAANLPKDANGKIVVDNLGTVQLFAVGAMGVALVKMASDTDKSVEELLADLDLDTLLSADTLKSIGEEALILGLETALLSVLTGGAGFVVRIVYDLLDSVDLIQAAFGLLELAFPEQRWITTAKDGFEQVAEVIELLPDIRIHTLFASDDSLDPNVQGTFGADVIQITDDKDIEKPDGGPDDTQNITEINSYDGDDFISAHFEEGVQEELIVEPGKGNDRVILTGDINYYVGTTDPDGEVESDDWIRTDRGDDIIHGGSGINGISPGEGLDEVHLKGGANRNANLLLLDGDEHADDYFLSGPTGAGTGLQTAFIFGATTPSNTPTPEEFMLWTAEEDAEPLILNNLDVDLWNEVYTTSNSNLTPHFTNYLFAHDGTGVEQFTIEAGDDTVYLSGVSANTQAGIRIDGSEGEDTLNLDHKTDALNMVIEEVDEVLTATYDNGDVVDEALNFEIFDYAEHHFDAELTFGDDKSEATLDAGRVGSYDITGLDSIALFGDEFTDESQPSSLGVDYGDAAVTLTLSQSDAETANDPSDGGFLVHNFDVAEVEEATTRVINSDPTLPTSALTDTAITIDGDKQLFGGASFDFDKFDFAYNLGAERYMPAFNSIGFDGILTEEDLYKAAFKTFQSISDFGNKVADAGAGVGAATLSPFAGASWDFSFSLTFLGIGVFEYQRFLNSYQELMSRKYFGIHGEEYVLGPYNEDGTRTLTIIADPDDTLSRQEIVINNWEQGDYGIRLDIAEWGEGFDVGGEGTAKDARRVTQEDLSEANFSDDYIRGLLEPLGLVRDDDLPEQPEPPAMISAAPMSAGIGFASLGSEASAEATLATLSTTSTAASASGLTGYLRQGTDGADTLGGRSGDDTLIGYAGDDTLRGGGGRDTYVFGLGDGADTIIDAGPEGGFIRFRDGVDVASITYEEVPGDNGETDYLITYGPGDTILIKNWSTLTPETQALWEIQELGPTVEVPQDHTEVPNRSDPTPFLDGTADDDVLTGSEREEILQGFDGDDTMFGDGGADTMTGGNGADLIMGGAGRDRLDGDAGDDVLEGGIGRDTLRGGSGDDRYVFNIGDGFDTISDSTGTDTIVFGVGISPADIAITRESVSSMSFTLTTTGERIRVTNQYNEDGRAGDGIERIAFDDGTVWTRADIEAFYIAQSPTDSDDLLIGFDGRDEIRGGAGNDDLRGAGGADDYFWNRGDGNDAITDGPTSADPAASNRLFLGEGIAPDDITIGRGGGETDFGYRDQNGDWVEGSSNPNDLLLIVNGPDGGVIEINTFYDGEGANLVVFDDGTVWTRDYIYERSFEEQITDGDDRAYGTPLSDVIDGGAGNDRIEDREGDDLVIGGTGDDHLGYRFNSDGDDTFIGGAGNDRIEGGSGNDTYIFGADFGHDTVTDSRFELSPNDENRFIFTDHTFDEFTFQATGDQGLDLLMTTADGENSIYVNNWTLRKWVTTDSGWAEIRWQSLGEFEFSDGQIISADQIASIANISGEIPSGLTGTDGTDLLEGTDARDRLVGEAGDDTLLGGDGGDYLIGGDGNDQIEGGTGDDTISAGDGIDNATGDAGDDLIFGGRGNDEIGGGAGDDFLSGGGDNDVIHGGTGDDEIEGNTGDDILTGGSGDDRITGGAGSDIYRFNFGDGQDRIDIWTGRSAGDLDVMEFGPGIRLEDMRAVFVNATPFAAGGLKITFANGTADELFIENALLGLSSLEIRFDDGMTMTGRELTAWATGATSADDPVAASVATEGGYRQIQYGGEGDDFLPDLDANTTVIFGRGDGNDRMFVRDSWFFGPAQNVEVIIQDYAPEETVISRGGPENDDLIISFTTGDDTLTDINHFGWAGLYQEDGIDSVRFADGTVWNAADLAQLAGDASGEGSDSDDLFEGTAANETFDGAGGSDTYVYAAGGGWDTISDSGAATDQTDTLVLNAGIAPQDVAVSRSDDDILLAIGEDVITLRDQLAGDGRGIEQVTFQNGDVWTRATLISQLVAGQASDGDDALSGGEGAETLDGGEGDDTLTGGAGGDTYTYAAGDGNDVIVEGSEGGNDRLVFDSSIDSETTIMRRDPDAPTDLLIETDDGAVIRVQNQFADGGIEQVRFADGTILGRDAIDARALEGSQSDGDDVIVGTSAGDVVESGAGADWIDGGEGADIYVFNSGDGADVIADSGADGQDGIRFGGNILAEDVSFARSGDDLVITFPNAPSDQVTVTDHFNGHALTGILFSDGALWTAEMIGHLAETGEMLPGAEPLMLLLPSTGPLEPQMAVEDEAFAFDIPADLFQDPAAVTATLVNGDPLPDWLSFSEGSFSGTPSAQDATLLDITLSGIGTDGNPLTQTLHIGAIEVNDAPVAEGSIADVEVLTTEDIVLDLSTGGFTDEDDSVLYTTLEMVDGSELPSWLTFDLETMTITGRPPSYEVSASEPVKDFHLRLVAEDDAGLSASHEFTVTVQRKDPTIFVEGTDGNDTLTGSSSSEVFIAGTGDDRITGGGGNDIFVYNAGDGRDIIDNAVSGTGTPDSFGGVLRFGEGIRPEDVILNREGYVDEPPEHARWEDYYWEDLYITFAGTPDDQIIVQGQFGEVDDGQATLSRIEFHDGTVWTQDDLLAPYLESSEEVLGSGLDDTLIGADTDDVLVGWWGDDFLDGGEGDDTLLGGEGDDLYVWGYGAGSDVISDMDSEAGDVIISVDTLRFGPGIRAEDLTFTVPDERLYTNYGGEPGGTLIIGLAGRPETLTLKHQYTFQIGRSFGIDRFEFEDGTVLTFEQLDELVAGDGVRLGTNGDDTMVGTTYGERIIGGLGDDYLQGGLGDDTYVWSPGDGNDTIYESDDRTFDVLELGGDITAEDIALRRGEGNQSSDLYVDIIPTGETIFVDRQFQVSFEEFAPGSEDRLVLVPVIDEVRFSDGSAWNYDYLRDYFLTGTDADQELHGYEFQDDILDGGAGDDILNGYGGDDVYVFGRGYGNDVVDEIGPLNIFEEDLNVVRFTGDLTPDDILVERLADEDNQSGVAHRFTIRDTGEHITIAGDLNGGQKLQYEFHFEATGTVWDIEDVADAYVATVQTDGDDVYRGAATYSFSSGSIVETGAGNDALYYTSNDRLSGGEGSDTYLPAFGVTSGGFRLEDDGGAGDVDRLELTFGSATSPVHVSTDNNGRDLLLRQSSYSEPIVLINMALGIPGVGVEEVVLGDGTIIDGDWLRANATPSSASATIVNGTVGDDALSSVAGVDTTFDGGEGADSITGSTSGSDVYIWRPGDGNDVITDASGGHYSRDKDVLVLEGVSIEDAQLTLRGDDLMITYLPTGEVIEIKDHFDASTTNGYRAGLEEIIFDDGRYFGRDEIDAATRVLGTSADERLDGSYYGDTFFGGEGNDILVSGGSWERGEAEDVYLYRAGDGNDWIYDQDRSWDSIDRVSLNENDQLVLLDLNREDITISRVGNDLRIDILPTGEVIMIDNQFSSTTYKYGIEEIVFADGSKIEGRATIADMAQARGDSGNNTITGTSGDDIIIGEEGDDRLRGRDGDDEYRFSTGDGADIIEERASDRGSDRIVFDATVAEGDVTLARSADGEDLIIAYGDGDTITVQGHLSRASGEIAEIAFDNGAVWDHADIMTRLNNAGAGDDLVTGSANDDVLAGLEGDDTLLGLDGEDIYEYRLGDGNDTIRDDGTDWQEIDLVRMGPGILPEEVEVTRDGDNILLTITATGHTITLEDRLVDVLASADAVVFEDGTYWDYLELLRRSDPAAGNSAPVAQDDTATTEFGTALVLDVADLLANDADIDGHGLTITSVTAPIGGDVSMDGTTITFTPNDAYVGTAEFTYIVQDIFGARSSATVSIAIDIGDNTVPVTVADAATLAEDATTLVDVLANDADPDGDTLTLVTVGGATNGAASIQNGQIRFTPDADFNGEEVLTYTVSDGLGGIATGTLTITVTPENDLPVAVDDVASLNENDTVLIDVLANDADVDGDALTLASVTGVVNGTAIFENGQLRYTPDADFFGTEVLSYTVNDGNGGSASATVTVTVNEVNEAPVAVSDTAEVDEDETILIDVLANDTDGNGDTLTITDVEKPANGVAIIDSGQIRYFPDPDFNGSETITYTVDDGRGGVVTGVVNVTVNSVNDAPMATADTATLEEDGTILIDVLANDSDPDGGTLKLLSIDDVLNGSAVIEAGQIRFTPDENYNGMVTIAYTISDGQGGTASSSVEIDVTAVNDAPIAVNDTATVDSGETVLIDPLVNDSDPDGDQIYISNVSWSGGGTVSFVDGQLQYEAVDNFSSDVVITYTLSDGQAQSTGTVNVTVVQPNTGPVANDDVASVTADDVLILDVIANDTDADGDPLTIISVDPAVNGTVTIENNQLRYVPDAGFVGEETLSYTVSDGQGGSASASVQITVNPVDTPNNAPVAIDDTASVDQGANVLIDVLGNDSDPDGDTLTITSVMASANGTAVIEGDAIRYTPNAGFSGPDTITYEVSDGAGGTATASVQVEVAAVQAGAPIVVDDYVTVVSGGTILIDALANDSDPDGDGIYISSVAPTIAQSIQFVDGKILYEAWDGYTGVVEMVYTVTDYGGTSSTGSVFIDIVAPNSGPIANDDTASVDENGSVLIDVLANDDAGGGTLTITSVTPSANGTAVIEGGAIRYTPNPGFSGPDTITYEVSDGAGGTATASVQLDVAAVQDGAPIVVDDYVTVVSGGTILIDALANDSHPDGSFIYISNVAPTIAESLQFVNGQIQYEALANYTGVVEMVYTVSDLSGVTSTGTVFIDVVAPSAASAQAGLAQMQEAAPETGVGVGATSMIDALTLNVSEADSSLEPAPAKTICLAPEADDPVRIDCYSPDAFVFHEDVGNGPHAFADAAQQLDRGVSVFDFADHVLDTKEDRSPFSDMVNGRLIDFLDHARHTEENDFIFV